MQDDWKYSKETPLPPRFKPHKPETDTQPSVEDTVLSFSDWEVFDHAKAQHYVDLADVMLGTDEDDEVEESAA